jgi:hypothetical protein
MLKNQEYNRIQEMEKLNELPAYLMGVLPVQIGFLFFTVGISFMDGAHRCYREKRRIKYLYGKLWN